jgi:hypothetical protein
MRPHFSQYICVAVVEQQQQQQHCTTEGKLGMRVCASRTAWASSCLQG